MPGKPKKTRPAARPARASGVRAAGRQARAWSMSPARSISMPPIGCTIRPLATGVERAAVRPLHRPHWHGHNYVLEVTVRGRPDPDTGYTIDLGRLKRILGRAVVDPCDHRNLNEEVGFLRGVIPSTENLVIAFWDQIEPRIRQGTLYRVRLYETPRNFAEYFGPGGAPG